MPHAVLLTLAIAMAASVTAADDSARPVPPDVDRSWAQPQADAAPRLIAFTFDDGPLPGKTDQLLDAFKAVGWQATFCVVGREVAKQPALLKRIVAEGHEVAGHSMTHPDLTKLTPDKLEEEIGGCLRLIRDTANVEPRWFRTPYLALSPAVKESIRTTHRCGHLGMTLGSKDWEKPAPGVITKNCTGDVPHGAVILCHDWNGNTVAEMPAILADLKGRGYQGVTVSRLQEALGKR